MEATHAEDPGASRLEQCAEGAVVLRRDVASVQSCRDIGGPFGGNRSPEYLALNPNGLVPTIDDDGFVLWESNVILRYLAAKQGAIKLYPTDLRQRAEVERWMDWQQTSVTTPMGVLFRAMLRSPIEPTDAATIETARTRAAAIWGILDRALERNAYVAGSGLTLADIALGNAVHRWFRLPIERPPLAHVQAWYQRLCERPSYRQYIAGFSKPASHESSTPGSGRCRAGRSCGRRCLRPTRECGRLADNQADGMSCRQPGNRSITLW